MKRWPGFQLQLSILIMLILAAFAPVKAFKVMDDAMCKDIDKKSMECVQRSSEYEPNDKWAYLWVRGTFEPSDVGAEVRFQFFGPTGNMYAATPEKWKVVQPITITGWMGIGIARANWTAFIQGGFEWNAVFTGTRQGVADTPGSWRAEFMVGNMVVVSEHFSIGQRTTTTTLASPVRTIVGESTATSSSMLVGTRTVPIASTFPVDPILLVGIVLGIAIISIVAMHLYTQRGKSQR